MNYYIANFGQLKKMSPNDIPINTTVWPPKFWKLGPDSNNVFLGINEELLSPYKVDISDGCQKDCPHREHVPECPFLIKYRAYLDTIDFDYILSEFNRVAEDVRKITHYTGDYNIVLMVYEAEGNPCSERQPLKDLFKKHNIELKDYRPAFIEFPIDNELPF